MIYTTDGVGVKMHFSAFAAHHTTPHTLYPLLYMKDLRCVCVCVLFLIRLRQVNNKYLPSPAIYVPVVRSFACLLRSVYPALIIITLRASFALG